MEHSIEMEQHVDLRKVNPMSYLSFNLTSAAIILESSSIIDHQPCRVGVDVLISYLSAT